jgi:hypothetical protein
MIIGTRKLNNMRYITSIVVLLTTIYVANAQVKTVAKSNYVSKVWVADQGNGTYKNPVLNADYSDPDAIRGGQ